MRSCCIVRVRWGGGVEWSGLRFFSLYEKEGKTNNFSASSSVSAAAAAAIVATTTTVTLAFFHRKKKFWFLSKKERKKNQFLKGPGSRRVQSEQ
ncbi:hypothetical protein glysoja_019999 [Glycine soja]|nr:hypothetical protein glysoja_019999 [Glycine soja]